MARDLVRILVSFHFLSIRLKWLAGCEERRAVGLIFPVARFKALMPFEAFYSADGHMGRLCFRTDMDRKNLI